MQLFLLIAIGFMVHLALRPGQQPPARRAAAQATALTRGHDGGPSFVPDEAPASSQAPSNPSASSGTPARPWPPLGDPRDIPVLEEEIEVRLREDPAFEEILFEAFVAERDPMWMSFLQNALATDPRRRNSASWQDRLLRVAETDASTERRRTALLFIQQAEAIGSVRDRLFALAARSDLKANVLVTLAGLPGRRVPDAALTEFAADLAEHDPDPRIRGLALRIEGNAKHAERLLGDPHPGVRLQACQLVTSREHLQRAMASETDPGVRQILAQRLPWSR